MLVEPLKTHSFKAIWYQGEVMQEDQKSMLKYYQHLSPIENSLIMLPCFYLFIAQFYVAVKDLPSQSIGATERIPVNSILAIYQMALYRVRRNGTTFIPKKKKEVNTSGSNSSENGFIMIQK
jgi:amino acid permease